MHRDREQRRSSVVKLVLVWVVLWLAAPAWPQTDYSRPVDVAPNEEAIGEGYVTPEVQRPRATSVERQILDLALLAAALGLAAWIVLGRRSRVSATAFH